MAELYPPRGNIESPSGEFIFSAHSRQILTVQTVEETRRSRLQFLIKKHGGQSSLVAAIARPEITASKLSRIANANIRHDRGGAVYVMGSDVAREIEQSLGLQTGWMDTPMTWAEMHGQEDPRAKVMLLMEALPPDQWSTAVRLLDALAQPAKNNGTSG